MTTIEKLKVLEAAADPAPWHDDIYGLVAADGKDAIYYEGVSPENLTLVEVLRNLAPELIALWEAANILNGDCATFTGDTPRVLVALNALNAKAAEVLK